MVQSKKRPKPAKDHAVKKIRLSALGGRKLNIYNTKRFPVQKIHELLESKFPGGAVRSEAAIFLTGVLEYIAVEILELSENAAKTSGRRGILTVTLEDMLQAISSDAEITQLIDKVRIREQIRKDTRVTEQMMKDLKIGEHARKSSLKTGEQTTEGTETSEELLKIYARVVCC
ncbi:histone H2A-like [Argiope bruennichi]|uniref:Histone H2A n=1 Tax=Argiope bruennichi TaxID=94029 RepID=A0A8T0E6K2_ARGBR|nr:histone H2A-like [Argiope bruennichi]KAF8766906.1 Histone H2A like protein [Argiope bruennichi]